MENIELKAEKREIKGRKVKSLRKKGMVPGEVYGKEYENVHISIPTKKLINIYKKAGGNTIINLSIGKEVVPSLITDIQIDPITDQPLSVDFYKIKEGQKLQTEIPINFVGESPLEDEGYVLVKVLREIEVESTPKDLPSEIKIDLSEIKSEDDMIYVKDIKFPQGVEPLESADTAVVTITEQREEIEEEPVEEGILSEELELGGLETEGDEDGDEDGEELESPENEE